MEKNPTLIFKMGFLLKKKEHFLTSEAECPERERRGGEGVTEGAREQGRKGVREREREREREGGRGRGRRRGRGRGRGSGREIWVVRSFFDFIDGRMGVGGWLVVE